MSRIKIDPPILYNNQTCPYCMRARLALAVSNTVCEIREIDFKDKPKCMLQASPKGSVPVLVLPDGQVIEESMEVLYWALQQNDPEKWMQSVLPDDVAEDLVARCGDLGGALVRLKKPEKFDDADDPIWPQKAAAYLEVLEERLTGEKGTGLGGKQGFSLTDIAILPFVVQYAEQNNGALVDQARFSKIAVWVETLKAHPIYAKTRQEYNVWQVGDAPTLFPAR